MSLEAQLETLWMQRGDLRATGHRLRMQAWRYKEEAQTLCENGEMMLAVTRTLAAHSESLFAEANLAWAQGDKLWASGVFDLYGNVTIVWLSGGSCIVDGRDRYESLDSLAVEQAQHN